MTIRNGQDLAFNTFGDEYNCMFYYFLDKSLQSDSTILGYAPTIQSVSYNPFIDKEDLYLVASKFDTEKYGTPREDVSRIPNVYRITDNYSINKTIYTQTLKLEASKEPILNYYPYRYLMLYDGFNQPLIIKPQYLDRDGVIEVKVRTNINQNSKYLLYLNGYKGDYTGCLEGLNNDVPLMLPVSSSAYAQFWATSSAQFNQSFINTSIENQTSYNHNTQNMELQHNQSVTNNTISGVSNALSSIASLFTLNFGGTVSGLGGVANNISSAYYNKKGYDLSKNQAEEIKANSDYFNEANRMATLKDFKKSPRGVISLGNDVSYSKMKSGCHIRLYDITLEPTVLRKLEKFYHKYGYPLNKYVDGFKIGNIRENFNFVKMGYCDVFGEKIPKDDLDIIKTIFETGITFWNVENDIRIGDYSVTNNERS